MARKDKKEKRPGIIRRSFGSMFNVRRWLAYDDLVDSGRKVFGFGKSLFVLGEAKHHETYEEAVQRLKLTENDIEERRKGFLRLALIYLCVAVALLVYMVYLFWHGHLASGFLSLMLMVLVFVYAYREHFWYMQVKNHRFGLKFREWLKLTIHHRKG